MRLRLAFLLLVGAPGCSDYAFHGKDDASEPASAAAQPAVELSPDPVDFGVLEEEAVASQVVTVHNPGDAELHIAAVRVDGPAVFSVSAPESNVVPAGGSTVLTVTYAPSERSSDHQGRLDVSSDAPDRPTASVQLMGALALEDVDSGAPGPDEGTECGCPDGFAPTADDTMCFRETETPATPSGEAVEVCAIAPYFAYGMFGVLYPGGTVVRDAYWGQDDGTANGRLNTVGVWGCASSGSTVAGSDPVGSWVGFSVCVDVASDGDYLLGLGGDNRVRFAVDGSRVMEQTGDDTRNFNYWFMHAVPLTAGTHIIDVEGYNAGSIAAFGAELAGPFSPGTLTNDAAMEAADYAGNVVWTTSDAIGNAFPLGDAVEWTCPDGTELAGCEEPVCVEREEVPCESSPE